MGQEEKNTHLRALCAHGACTAEDSVEMAQIALLALDHCRDTVRFRLGSQWRMCGNENVLDVKIAIQSAALGGVKSMRGNLLGLCKEVKAEKRGHVWKEGIVPSILLTCQKWHFPTLPDVSAAWTHEIGLPSEKAEPLLCLKLPLFMKWI